MTNENANFIILNSIKNLQYIILNSNSKFIITINRSKTLHSVQVYKNSQFQNDKNAKKETTRKSAGFGGAPAEFPARNLPSYGDVARYFYLVESYESDQTVIINTVTDAIVAQLGEVNPNLPLIAKKSIRNKITRFMTDKVRHMKRKHVKKSANLKIEEQIDQSVICGGLCL